MDSQLPAALARWLAAQGADAVHVLDLDLDTTPDVDLWSRASTEARKSTFVKDLSCSSAARMCGCAQAHAESEFEEYRIVQDRLFESDFDRMIKKMPQKGDNA